MTITEPTQKIVTPCKFERTFDYLLYKPLMFLCKISMKSTNSFQIIP